MRIRYALTLAALAILPILAQTPAAQRPAGADWPMYNRDFAGTRFSPLTQIDTTNVTKLTKAWSYQLQPASGNALAERDGIADMERDPFARFLVEPGGNGFSWPGSSGSAAPSARGLRAGAAH